MSERVPFVATNAAAGYDGIRPPVSLLLHNVRSMYNVGAFFRTADGAGIQHIYLSGITARPPKKQISKTALGSEDRVAWTGTDDPIKTVTDLQKSGYEIAAIETTAHAVDIFDWRPRFPLCVLFGHEVEGLESSLLGLCDTHVRIPMLGLKHSLNVSTAGAVVMYEVLRKYRDLLAKG